MAILRKTAKPVRQTKKIPGLFDSIRSNDYEHRPQRSDAEGPSFTTVNRNLPCLNPNCNSHGKPHPNCHCYGFSGGGEVDNFCSSANPHKEDCQYYMKDGGSVNFSDLTDEGPPLEQHQTDQKNTNFENMEDEGPPPIQQAVPNTESSTNEPTKSIGALEAVTDAAKIGLAASPIGEMVGYRPDVNPQSKAAVQAAAVGYIPFAKQLDSALGINALKDYDQAEQNYPGTTSAFKTAGIATSMGGGALAGVKQLAGGKVLGNVLQSVGQTTMDDAERYLTGHGPHNAKDAVAAWVAHVIPGALFSTALGVSEPLLQKIPDGLAKNITKIGENAINKIKDYHLPEILEGGAIGRGAWDMWHGNYEKGGKKIAAGLAGVALNKYIGTIATKALADGIPEAISTVGKFGDHISSGLKAIAPLVDSAVKAGASQFFPYATDKNKEYFKKYIEDGGPQKQLHNEKFSLPGYAKGGKVEPSQDTDHFSQMYPEANMLINQARGRIYSYMNSIRPETNKSKLAFDDNPPNKQKKREYDNATELAINPLSIMNKVNKGDLTSEDMKHFTALWPEMHSLLSKKLTEKITESQLRKEKPPFKKRQALSLFMGVDLDGSLTPQAIQTIQNMYAMKGQSQQPQTEKPKKSGNLSKLGTSAMTDEQARTNREQNQKA